MKLAATTILFFVLASSAQGFDQRRGSIDGPSRLDPSMRWSDIDRAGPGRGPWIDPRTSGPPAVGGPIRVGPPSSLGGMGSSSNRRY